MQGLVWELQNLLINVFCQDLGSYQIKKTVNLLQREVECFLEQLIRSDYLEKRAEFYTGEEILSS